MPRRCTGRTRPRPKPCCGRHYEDRSCADCRSAGQHPVGRFILDFYCPRKKLCVELDGSSHDGREMMDEARTEALATLNIRVIRFRNEEVLNDLPSVLQRIEAAVTHP